MKNQREAYDPVLGPVLLSGGVCVCVVHRTYPTSGMQGSRLEVRSSDPAHVELQAATVKIEATCPTTEALVI